MSGSIAAIAAYDGTGTQSYGTTDKNLSGVKSIFWNENDTDKYYVNGCSFSEVSNNKGAITSPETIVFTFDNDADAINDLTLAIERKGILDGSNIAFVPVYYMLYFIERIEVCIGNQVICTINTTQLVKHFFENDAASIFLNYSTSDYQPYATPATLNDDVSAQTIKLNIFRMLSNNGMDSSYLMCCANNQTIQVKVYPQNFTQASFKSYAGLGNADVTLSDQQTFTFNLYANKYSMTNAERDFLRNQVIPKRTNITQYAELTEKPDGNLTVGSKITINCDHFNLYTSNLYILGLCESLTPGGFDVELYLNSTSFSGVIPYFVSFAQPTQAAVPGLNIWNRFLYYRIPIAKNAHMKETDQDYVPFSKFDSIRVVLTCKNDIILNNYRDFFDTLTVVAEGKCTALYQNGAVLFNNY